MKRIYKREECASRRSMVKYYCLYVALLLAAVGCVRQKSHDERLNNVASLIEKDSFQTALKSLDKINANDLSEKDARYYDFLKIKASDKMYIKHESDTVIRRVLDYYDKNKTDKDYPEVLYYGGRVYSDLGDYPTAIRYYEMALDKMQGNNIDLNLKANVLSQTGRLMNDMRLCSEAVPYLEQSLEIDSILGDSYNLVYDRLLLGIIQMHLLNNQKADSLFRVCMKEAKRFDDSDYALQQLYLAANFKNQNKKDSALKYIRGIPERVDTMSRDCAWAFASVIYYRAGEMDTARIYAERLLNSKSSDNKKTGYEIILSPGIVENIPADKSLQLIKDYRNYLETTISKSDREGAIIQNSWYNYDVHERERHSAEESRSELQKWLSGIVAILLGVLCFVLYLRIKYKNVKYMTKI